MNTKIHYEHCMRDVPGIAHTIKNVTSIVTVSGVPALQANITSLFADGFGVGRQQSVLLESMVRYQFAGQQAFVVGPGMRTAFEHTALDGVSYDDLHLPHEAFYIALPECSWLLWGGESTGWHTVYGLYVNRTPQSIAFAVCGAENDRSTGHGDDAHAWIRMSPPADQSLETYLQRTLNGGPAESYLSQPPEEAVQRESIVSAVRVAINLCMYLSSDAASTSTQTPAQRRAPLEVELRRKKNPGKAKVIERRIAQLSTATVTHVGGHYEKQLAGTMQGTDIRQHIVRGHWHTYWVGEGRTKKIRKWVLPFVRGSKDPAYESRVYVIPEHSTHSDQK